VCCSALQCVAVFCDTVCCSVIWHVESRADMVDLCEGKHDDRPAGVILVVSPAGDYTYIFLIFESFINMHTPVHIFVHVYVYIYLIYAFARTKEPI